MDTLVNTLRALQQLGRKLGPYLLLEMLLPGGTLFALLLFLYQRRPAIALAPRILRSTGSSTIERSIGRAVGGYRYGWIPCQE